MRKFLTYLAAAVFWAAPAWADPFSDMVTRLPNLTPPFQAGDLIPAVRNGIPYHTSVPVVAAGTRLSLLAMPVINARDPVYGMKCDGATDDKAALTAALNAAATMGASVFISGSPSGLMATCLMSTWAPIPAGVTLWAVPGTVTLKPTATGTAGLLSVVSVSNVMVTGLILDGGGKDFPTVNTGVVVFGGTPGVDNVVFDDVTFQNMRSIAIIFSSAVSNSGVRNSRFTNIGNHWQTTLNPADAILAVSFCCGLTERNYGNFMINNSFADLGIDAISTTQQRDFLATENRCNIGNNYEILAPSNVGAACVYGTANDQMTVTNNTSDGASGNGIDILSVKSSVVVGNRISHSGDSGIGIFGSGDAVVTGNIVKNNGTLADANIRNGGAGIALNNAANGGRISVSGNVATDDQSAVSTTCSGTVAIGATSCTVASIAGMAVNGIIKIAGAGVAAADLRTKIRSIGGTTTVTWWDATSTLTSGAAVTGVTTQRYAAFGCKTACVAGVASTYTDLKLGYDNVVSGNLNGEFGGVLPPAFAGFPPFLLAARYGVVGDGTTSNDVFLKAATDACAAAGATLILPSGQIKLTGAAQSTLQNCKMQGQGQSSDSGQFGTTFILTSTSVVPFILGDGGIGIESLSFYWPDQTSGTTVYPALFTDTASGVSSMSLDHVNIVNAYDGLATSATSGGIGRLYISHSNLYAVHDLLKIGSVGDMILIDNTVFNYGAWQEITGGSAGFKAAINAADATNTILHCVAPTTGAGCVIQIANSSAFAWGFGVKLDATGKIDQGKFDVLWDGVGTVLDSTSGGTVANTTFTCPSGCISGIVDAVNGISNTGKPTAFSLGANGSVQLNNFNYNSAAGSVVVSSGSNVTIEGGSFAFGAKDDGTDFYVVNLTAGSASHVDVRNALLSGIASSTKHHGVKMVSTGGFNIQNTRSINLNDTLNAALGAGRNSFTGNASESTTGTSAIITSGTGALAYAANNLDKPAAPTVSACGTGATVSGTILHGFITVGSTNPTTSCVLTMPFPIPGSGGGDCIFGFTGVGNTVGGAPAGSPPAWTITTANDVHGSQIFYRCSADQ